MMRSERGEIEALRKQIGQLTRAESGPSLEDCARSPGLVSPSRGRIVVLVGPTGVGKTTTIAKLAARAHLAEERKVAIITLDSYRVGGEEQVRTFADLIGVPLLPASGPIALARALRSLGSMDKIYIDTAGRSPRDADAIAELQATLSVLDEPETHLVVTAGSSLTTIESIYNRFKPVAPSRLLLTKTDECDDLPQIVQAPFKLSLPVTYITTGQRVPEDIEDATTTRLVGLARGAEAA
jgi:flagellar biosynthesis protein FlhF